MAAAATGKPTAKPEWDQTFEPVMKLLLGKKGIKTKSASEIGKKKVDYFRGKDFKKYMLENPTPLKKKCPEAIKAALSEGAAVETEKDCDAIGDELISRNFCYKAVYKPINPRSDGKEKKWPDRLAKAPSQKFECDGYYVVVWDAGGGMRNFYLALLIAGILLACMFPVWPFWAKVGVWYLSVIFLTLYFGILILRLIVYVLFWIVGFDFWILPNINDEYCGFLDSFKPGWSWDKRADDFMMLFVRFIGLAITAVAVQQIAETHSLADVKDFVSSSYADIIDWGIDKLVLEAPEEKIALPSYEELKEELDANETAEDDPTATGVPSGMAEAEEAKTEEAKTEL